MLCLRSWVLVTPDTPGVRPSSPQQGPCSRVLPVLNPLRAPTLPSGRTRQAFHSARQRHREDSSCPAVECKLTLWLQILAVNPGHEAPCRTAGVLRCCLWKHLSLPQCVGKETDRPITALAESGEGSQPQPGLSAVSPHLTGPLPPWPWSLLGLPGPKNTVPSLTKQCMASFLGGPIDTTPCTIILQVLNR